VSRIYWLWGQFASCWVLPRHICKDISGILTAPVDKDLEKEEMTLEEDLAQQLKTNIALVVRCNDKWKRS